MDVQQDRVVDALDDLVVVLYAPDRRVSRDGWWGMDGRRDYTGVYAVEVEPCRVEQVEDGEGVGDTPRSVGSGA